MATPDHIDIRTDFSGVDLETYREDVKERFDIGKHPKVRNMRKRVEQMKSGARGAFEDAAQLRAQAEAKEEDAASAAADGDDEEADALYEEAADLQQQADRRQRIAESKTRTLQKWIRDTDAASAIAPAVDDAKTLISEMDAPAQPKRDKVSMDAESEHRAAAQEEMRHLLAHLKETAEPFFDAVEKAKALSKNASHAAGGFGGLDALDGIREADALASELEGTFEAHGVETDSFRSGS